MTWNLKTEHIGGIIEGEAEIEPAINIVHAENWQGKSSFLKAVETAFGTAKPLTEGRSRGRVELETERRTVEVELYRENDRIVREGTPYLTSEYDRKRAELFAFLGEQNAVREAVRRGNDLSAELTAPLDLQNIDEQITELKREREQVETRITEAKEATREVVSLETEIAQLTEELEQLREEYERVDDNQTSNDEDESQTLAEKRTELEREQAREKRLRDSVDRIEAKITDLKSSREELDLPEVDVEEELADVEESLQELETDLDLLQSLYSVNRRIMEEDRVDLLTGMERSLLDDTLTCWVCGADRDRSAVEKRLEAMNEQLSELRSRRNTLESRREKLEAKRQEKLDAKRQHEEIERQLSDLKAKRADRERSLASTHERIEELERTVESLSESVAETTEKLTELESEIRYTETELEECRDSLETKQKLADRQSHLEERYEDLTDEIVELRTEKEQRKRMVREEFEQAVDETIDRFETGFETARLTDNFELVVAREGREANLHALSEGERELLGVLVALAGYEAFEVSSDVPIFLLDGLGALSESNLKKLVEYVADRTERLLFTGYPEYTTEEIHRIDPTGWTVVSDETGEGSLAAGDS